MGHHTLLLLWPFVVGVLAVPVPEPVRMPKVYNALITSSQNLEPSKAFPVYQPVLHDPFAYSYQPTLFYGGDFPGGNGLIPQQPGLIARIAPPAPLPQEQAESSTESKVSSTEAPVAAPEDSPSPPAVPEESPADDKSLSSTPVPPPPSTQSPIPLNEFGLPPQVLPLGPGFNGYSQVGPLTYSYPGLRFYDPYDPFGWNPYANLPPLYRTLPNVLNQPTFISSKDILSENPPIQVPSEEPQETGVKASSDSPQSPPPEPSDLNVLNYSSKDPAIPNVPPPPLPEGGLKSDKE